MIISLISGMSIGALLAAIWWILALTRQIARLEVERSVLVDRLLIKSGQPPMVHQHEEVVKLPDLETISFPTPYEQAYEDDQIVEEAERLKPECKGLRLDDIKQRYPMIHEKALAIFRNNKKSLRV